MSFMVGKVLSSIDIVLNLLNAIYGMYTSDKVKPKVTKSNSENGVAMSLQIKMAIGTLSDLAQNNLGNFYNTIDWAAERMMALILVATFKEGSLIMMQKRLKEDNAKSMKLITAALRCFTGMVVDPLAKQLIDIKLKGAMRFGRIIHKQAKYYAQSISLFTTYLKDATIYGKERAELKLIRNLAIMFTTEIDGVNVTDQKAVGTVLENLTNYYFILVASQEHSLAKNELESSIKEDKTVYSTHRSVFFKGIRKVCLNKTFRIFDTDVRLKFPSNHVISYSKIPYMGEMVDDIGGIVGGLYDTYKLKGVTYLMPDDTMNVFGWAGHDYDARKKCFDELEENGYKFKIGKELEFIVEDGMTDEEAAAVIDDFYNFVLYSYMHKPASKGEMMGALAHILIERGVTPIFKNTYKTVRRSKEAEAMERKDAIRFAYNAAYAAAKEYLQERLVSITACRVDPSIKKAEFYQEQLNKFLSETCKKVPVFSLGQYEDGTPKEAIFIKKAKFKGVQTITAFILDKGMKSGVLSNYSTLPTCASDNVADILKEVMTKDGINQYVQKADFRDYTVETTPVPTGKRVHTSAKFFNLRKGVRKFTTSVTIDPDFTNADGVGIYYGPMNRALNSVFKVVGINEDGSSVVKCQLVFKGYAKNHTIITNADSLKGAFDESNLGMYECCIIEEQKPAVLKDYFRVTGKGLIDQLSRFMFDLFRILSLLIFKNGEFFLKNVIMVHNFVPNDFTKASDNIDAVYMNSATHAKWVKSPFFMDMKLFAWGFPFFGNIAITDIIIDDSIADDIINVSSQLAWKLFRDFDGDRLYLIRIPVIFKWIIEKIMRTYGKFAYAYKLKEDKVDFSEMSNDEMYTFFGLVSLTEWRRIFDDKVTPLNYKLDQLNNAKFAKLNKTTAGSVNKDVASTSNKYCR